MRSVWERKGVGELVAVVVGELVPRRSSVWTMPWMLVTGVRSSCAASAMKFDFSSSARSRAIRWSRSLT